MRTTVVSDISLHRDRVQVTVRTDPFSVTVARDGTTVLGPLVAWAAEGEVRDRFVQLTEGVIADEAISYEARVEHAVVVSANGVEAVLEAMLSDGRVVLVTVRLGERDGVTLELRAVPGSRPGDRPPLRWGWEWAAAEGEHWAGLGPRHGHEVDQAGRTVRLAADRRYTGPACPPELREAGGIPMGDYAPVPFALSSAGYAVWLETWGEGPLFELGAPVRVSARGVAGSLRMDLLCDGGMASPVARLRHYCRLTGFPMLLPEWGYGHWKSRDVHPHQDDVVEDLEGYRWHGIPLDAIVLDSPWETQYNTWEFNPRQFPDAPGMVARLRAAGVRTVVWITPWVNLDSSEGLNNGQVPPDGLSEKLHRQPAPGYFEAASAGHFVRDRNGKPLVAKWWMGTGSPVDVTRASAAEWWEGLARSVLALGVEGIKADDGEGFYIPPDARVGDPGAERTGAEAAWAWSDAYRDGMQRALDEATGGSGVLFARSGWSGGQRHGVLWGGDQISDFFSLRMLLVATLSAAASGYSNWSHDVGGYLGRKMVERCDRELLIRWAQVGCFTPLMQAHGRFAQEAWSYDRATLARYRSLVVLHERLVPYIRACASLAARSGLPVIRPLSLVDPGDPDGWGLCDAFFFGPSLWVAPVLDRGAVSRTTWLPRGSWIDFWTGERVSGGREVFVEASLDRIPVWVRDGSLLVTYPEAHVRFGLGDVPELSRPLEATLWGRPAGGRALARLADGTRVRWSARAGWSWTGEREVDCRDASGGFG